MPNRIFKVKAQDVPAGFFHPKRGVNIGISSKKDLTEKGT